MLDQGRWAGLKPDRLRTARNGSWERLDPGEADGLVFGLGRLQHGEEALPLLRGLLGQPERGTLALTSA